MWGIRWMGKYSWLDFQPFYAFWTDVYYFEAIVKYCTKSIWYAKQLWDIELKCVKYFNVMIFLLKIEEKKTGHLVLYNAALVIMMVGQICSQNAWHVAPIYPGSLQTDSTQSGPTIQSSHPTSIITTVPLSPPTFITQDAQNMGKYANSRQAFKNVWELFLPCHQSGYIKHTKNSYLGESESSFW